MSYSCFANGDTGPRQRPQRILKRDRRGDVVAAGQTTEIAKESSKIRFDRGHLSSGT